MNKYSLKLTVRCFLLQVGAEDHNDRADHAELYHRVGDHAVTVTSGAHCHRQHPASQLLPRLVALLERRARVT